VTVWPAIIGGDRSEQGRGLGKRELIGGSRPSATDARAYGNRLASRAGVDWGRRRAGPTAEKMAHDDFFSF
jgi:hypothetical protein